MTNSYLKCRRDRFMKGRFYERERLEQQRQYDNFDQFIDFELMTGTGDVSNDTDKTSNSNSAKKQAQNAKMMAYRFQEVFW